MLGITKPPWRFGNPLVGCGHDHAQRWLPQRVLVLQGTSRFFPSAFSRAILVFLRFFFRVSGSGFSSLFSLRPGGLPFPPQCFSRSARSGRVFLFFCFLLCSCILHILSLGQGNCIAGSPAAMTPAPAGPPSEPSPLTRLLLGVDGVTVRMEGLQGDRGHCNPPQRNLVMTIATVLPGGVAVNPPKNPVPFRQCLDSLGWLQFVRNFRCELWYHVGRPLWLRLFFASFLARRPPYLLPSWVLSFLGFVRKGFLLFHFVSVDLFLLTCCRFSCKTGQNAARFCFLFSAWVRSVLGLPPKKGTENRTERTLGCSGRSSASLFIMGFACPNGQSRTARVRSCVTVGFYGFFFSEVFGSVL